MTSDTLFPDAPTAVSIDRQIACVKRELAQRRRVYPRLIADGRMSQAKADEEIAVMEQVLVTLEQVRAIPGTR
jgi:hypothetical protein